MAASSTDCLGGVPEGSFFSGPPQEESAALRRAVLDLGTGSLKVGWAGERRPRHVLATCSGAVRRRPQLFVSDECLLLPEYICSRPASGGLWTDLDVLREVIDLSLSKRFLAADPETLAVALTQPILAPAATRRQLCEVFFEDFGIQRLAVCAAQALVPYAFWGFDGSGEDVTAPVKSSKQSLHLQKMKVHCYSGEEDGAGECGDPCLLSAPLSPARSSSRQRLSASFPEREVAREELASCGLSWVDARRNPFSLVVDCGFSCSHAVPCSGYTTMDGAALRSEVGGANANAYLKNLLAARGVCLEKKELFVQKVFSLEGATSHASFKASPPSCQRDREPRESVAGERRSLLCRPGSPLRAARAAERSLKERPSSQRRRDAARNLEAAPGLLADCKDTPRAHSGFCAGF